MQRLGPSIQVSGLNPTYIAMQPSSSFVWVAVNYEFMVINTSTNSVVAKISGLGTPLESIAFSPSGKTAYLTYGQGKIAVVNTSTRKVIATIQVPGNYSGPSGAAVTPDGKFLYVVNGEGSVSVFSTATRQVVATISLPGVGANGPVYAETISISTKGPTAFVAFFYPVGSPPPDSEGVFIIDTANNTVVNTIYVNDSPRSAVVSPNGNWVYVAQHGGSVTVIDTGTQTVAQTITVSTTPVSVTFTPDSAFAYVANDNGPAAPEIDTSTRTVVGGFNLTLPSYPISIAVKP